MTLRLHKNVCLYYATDELLQDVSAMESLVSGFCADEIAFQVEDAIIRGNGAIQLSAY